MHDHDLELIAALVEGRLDDEAEARALIASSPEHAEEYEAQKLAYETLQDLGTVSMSDTERAALHRDLWTSLRTAPSAVPSKRANPWWYRWTAVAAGLLVIGGSAAILSQNLGGGNDAGETFSQMAEALDADSGAAPTTTAAGAAEAPFAAGDSGGEADGASATTVATEEDDGSLQSRILSELYSTSATEVREADESTPDLRVYEDPEAVDPVITECVEMAAEVEGLQDYQVVATTNLAPLPDPMADASTTTVTPTTTLMTTTTLPALQAHSLAVASPEGVDPAVAPLAFVSLDTCEVVYLDE